MTEEDIVEAKEPEHISSLKDRLQQVADEIDTIKTSFFKKTSLIKSQARIFI